MKFNLDDFFTYIYGKQTGFAYIAAKNSTPEPPTFERHFFEWPGNKHALINKIQELSPTCDVFYSPALMVRQGSTKLDVKTSQVVWCEFDGVVPDVNQLTNGLPPPSLRVASSVEGHEHWYWKLASFEETEVIEYLNRGLSYNLGADISGWDACQVLRPILTFNHKRQQEVRLLQINPGESSPEAFKFSLVPPPIGKPLLVTALPPVDDVLSAHQLPVPLFSAFKKGTNPGSRSDLLMSLGYSLAELQLSNLEILSLLVDADERWGKFKNRSDKMVRLQEIVVRARAKYPMKPVDLTKRLNPMGFSTMLATKSRLTWVWEGFLQEKGYLLVTGPSGIGKTQFSLDTAYHLVLGETYLERKVPRPLKIGFFSLEMGLEDLKHFVERQSVGFTDEERAVLEQNLQFFPLGESFYLNDPEEKKHFEDSLKEHEFDGIMIDSLGSAISGELSTEKDAKSLMDYVDHVRQQFNCFVWFVHHHRKASSDNKRPNKLSDIYGSHYFTARATTVLTLWDGPSSNIIHVLPLKLRLAEKPSPFMLIRDAELRFKIKPGDVLLMGGDYETGDSPSLALTPDDIIAQALQPQFKGEL